MLEDAEVWRAARERGGFIAATSVPVGVQEALEAYRPILRDQGWRVIQEDNEGFEAEIYVRRGKRLGAVQIRQSQCDDASVVFVQVVDPDQLGGGLPSATPS